MRCFGEVAGVQTFRYKQSSLLPDGGFPPCMGPGANLSACRTPSHFLGGCGARQRRSPTGGSAKGIPLYTTNPSSNVPCNKPCSTLTGCWAIKHPPANNRYNTLKNFFIF